MALSRALRAFLGLLGATAALSLGLALLLAWLFSLLDFQPQGEEVQRLASPDGLADAVLLAGKPGDGAASYVVYVVRHGARPAGLPVAVLGGLGRGGEPAAPGLAWESPRLLVVESADGAGGKLYRPSVAVAGEALRVALREDGAEWPGSGGDGG